MSDDDVPPPLSSLQDQVDALSLGPSPSGVHADGDEGSMRVASTTIAGASSASQAAKPAIKKGFFDAKPKAPGRPKAAAATQPSSSAAESIPMLRGKKDAMGKASIPEFMKVEPDEQTKKLQEMKSKLVTALAPTQESIAGIASNPELMAAFADPEVMAAVDEIAKDPRQMNKYKDNKKVQAFYKAMAGFAGSQLEKQGNKPL